MNNLGHIYLGIVVYIALTLVFWLLFGVSNRAASKKETDEDGAD
jgi:hypothetical protein